MIAIPPPQSNLEQQRTEQNESAVTRAITLLSAFRYAFAGVGYLLSTQRNAKIHCAIAAVAVTCGVWVHITRGEWLALVLAIGLVLATEGINTAIEAIVDLASPAFHPLAKIAKDVAAGTVLITAITSVVIGLIVFLPYFLPMFLGWLH